MQLRQTYSTTVSFLHVIVADCLQRIQSTKRQAIIIQESQCDAGETAQNPPSSPSSTTKLDKRHGLEQVTPPVTCAASGVAQGTVLLL